MLKHHADACQTSLSRFLRRKGRTIKLQAALIGLHNAINHFDERRLAGAIFAQQGMDMSRRNLEADVVIGDNTRKGFCYPANEKAWNRGVHD